MRGRFAPSPTGGLHVGNARTALLAFLQVRAQGGAFVMRVEDLDRAREVKGATAALLEDLRWLGLSWDEGPDEGGPFGPYLQSARDRLYDEALAALQAKGLVYECFCSRKEIAQAASAPHGPSDEGPRYPGTCRNLTDVERQARREAGRKPAIRFRVPDGPFFFDDELHGRVSFDVQALVGDFVVRRVDGIYAYQLACAFDDGAMQMTDVLRGDDLLSSTPRQLMLLEALSLPVPKYAHVPLLLGADGQRLSKRAGDVTLSALRQRGVDPQRLVAALARSCGLTDAEAISPDALVPGFSVAKLAKAPGSIDLSRL